MEAATLEAAKHTGPDYVFGPGYSPDGRLFHPLALAISFFFVWIFAGLGSPSSVVRVMACKNTEVLRRSIFLLSWYNLFIYIPLIVICVCGRALIPDLPAGQSDEIVPRLAFKATEDLPGGSFLAGLILAAPFGAVMATVSSYLVVIASGLVRDVYQRFIDPQITTTGLKRLSYLVMILVGAVAVGLNIQPVTYLQTIVVFSGTGSAASLVIPLFMIAFWRRATAPGAIAAMLSGAGVTLSLYVAGWITNALGTSQKIGERATFGPYYLLEFHPIIWGLLASLLAGVLVSLKTAPPEPERVAKVFDAPGT